MAYSGLLRVMARPCAARSAALAVRMPRAEPASPPEPALNMAVRCSFQPGGALAPRLSPPAQRPRRPRLADFILVLRRGSGASRLGQRQFGRAALRTYSLARANYPRTNYS